MTTHRAMKPLTKEQQEEAIRLLRNLLQKVDRYSKSHAATVKTTAQHKLHDTMALADAWQQADEWSRDLDYANTLAGIQYEVNIIEALTEGRDATRRGISPVLTDEEKDEMREWFEKGERSDDFAQMIYERDIGKFEKAQEDRDKDTGGGGLSDRERQDIKDAGRGHLIG